MNPYLDVAELAAWLHSTKASIYALVSMGKIPPNCVVRPNRRLLFDREAVMAWLRSLRGS
ncbi:MAG: helix-turn-helix domain-containing protein [Elusimicrobia bacterium]|nr:helix-turn-helix domain-containing protein [Elusimicrobiota bacterium]